MRKYYFLAIVMLSFCFCQNSYLLAQKYDFYKYRSYYNKAQMAKYNKNYKAEKKHLEKTFEYINNKVLIQGIQHNHYVDCLLNNHDTLAAIKIVEKTLAAGYVYFATENGILEKFGKKYGAELVQKMPKMKEDLDRQTSPEKENNLAVERLQTKDQEVREYVLKSNLPTEQRNKILHETDSANFAQLYDLVKNKNANPMSFLLYHIYGENRKYFAFYDSIYKAKVYAGEASPEGYVVWFDRQRMYVDGLSNQLYGEWNGEGNGSVQFNSIEDIANIDKRRAKLGLCSLADYALLHNLNLPKDYIPPKKKRK